MSNNVGLVSYLLKQNTLEQVIQTTRLPTLDFLASGKLPSSSMSILNSPQMRDLITELKQRYDFIFFDSPPILGVSDAAILASEVDFAMQVIQYRRYPQPMNLRAKQMIEKVGGNLVGIVLNNINMSQDESYYYYSGYYHDSGYTKDTNEPEAAGKTSDDAIATRNQTKVLITRLNSQGLVPMKLFWKLSGLVLLVCGTLFSSALLSGCASSSSDPFFLKIPPCLPRR